jgi:arylsulfatase A-like enzyme
MFDASGVRAYRMSNPVFDLCYRRRTVKAIMVMFDSLNRHMLPPYGCDWVKAPNFQRLSEKTVTFDNCYIGSMPCMPARREIHTGRYNFLHRGWCPLEPFDDSMPQILGENGIHSHLSTDHYHYWEDGGATYHERYSTYDFHRGQEGDKWKGDLTDGPEQPEVLRVRKGARERDFVNRHHMQNESDQPQPQTFAAGMEFINRNHAEDDWFLQIETFDPHEPYFTHQKYKELYPHEYDGPQFDWPGYHRVLEEERGAIEHVRYENAALISMCDHYLGKVLDLMDEHDLWKDTMLIVNTDHGFLLGEHDWWAKCAMPWYQELANTPFFIWDPRNGKAGERRQALVQTIDIAPTLLDYFGVDIPADMQGVPLRQTLADDTPVREAALYGVFGAHVNVNDGRYVYMRAPASGDNMPLNEYTLMPTRMKKRFAPEEFDGMELAAPFSFTKGTRVLKIPSRQPANNRYHEFGTLLYDLESDPKQENPITDPKVEARMVDLLVQLMKDNDAPAEQYERLGLTEA